MQANRAMAGSTPGPIRVLPIASVGGMIPRPPGGVRPSTGMGGGGTPIRTTAYADESPRVPPRSGTSLGFTGEEADRSSPSPVANGRPQSSEEEPFPPSPAAVGLIEIDSRIRTAAAEDKSSPAAAAVSELSDERDRLEVRYHDEMAALFRVYRNAVTATTSEWNRDRRVWAVERDRYVHAHANASTPNAAAAIADLRSKVSAHERRFESLGHSVPSIAPSAAAAATTNLLRVNTAHDSNALNAAASTDSNTGGGTDSPIPQRSDSPVPEFVREVFTAEWDRHLHRLHGTGAADYDDAEDYQLEFEHWLDRLQWLTDEAVHSAIEETKLELAAERTHAAQLKQKADLLKHRLSVLAHRHAQAGGGVVSGLVSPSASSNGSGSGTAAAPATGESHVKQLLSRADEEKQKLAESVQHSLSVQQRKLRDALAARQRVNATKLASKRDRDAANRRAQLAAGSPRHHRRHKATNSNDPNRSVPSTPAAAAGAAVAATPHQSSADSHAHQHQQRMIATALTCAIAGARFGEFQFDAVRYGYAVLPKTTHSRFAAASAAATAAAAAAAVPTAASDGTAPDASAAASGGVSPTGAVIHSSAPMHYRVRIWTHAAGSKAGSSLWENSDVTESNCPLAALIAGLSAPHNNNSPAAPVLTFEFRSAPAAPAAVSSSPPRTSVSHPHPFGVLAVNTKNVTHTIATASATGVDPTSAGSGSPPTSAAVLDAAIAFATPAASSASASASESDSKSAAAPLRQLVLHVRSDATAASASHAYSVVLQPQSSAAMKAAAARDSLRIALCAALNGVDNMHDTECDELIRRLNPTLNHHF